MRRRMMARKIPMLMKPSPPSWIMIRIITWPNRLHWVQVSTTTSPVTQVALVAVNRQFKNGSDCPSRLAIGSMRSSVPVMIIIKKPYAIN